MNFDPHSKTAVLRLGHTARITWRRKVTGAAVSATHHQATALHFEFNGIEGGLVEMDGAAPGGDDEVAIRDLRVCVSAGEKVPGRSVPALLRLWVR